MTPQQRFAIKHPERMAAANLKYRRKNRKKLCELSKEWNRNNRERRRIYSQKWWQDHPEKRRAYKKKHQPKVTIRTRNRRRADPNFKLAGNLRGRLNSALKGIHKSGSMIQLLGCSIESLWLYLESKFEEGMTRENHGKVWEVDHILPCAIFDLTKDDHQRRCFHFSNLQPLFQSVNRKKGAKILSTI